MKSKRRFKPLKFLRFILILLCLILVTIIGITYFGDSISAFIYNQTGIMINIPGGSGPAFWNKDTPASNADWQETEQSSDVQEENVFDSRLAALEGNTVIGINYSGMGNDPRSLAAHSDRIVRVKIKSVKVTAYDNVVHSEITANVKETYKGMETDEIQIYAYGGAVQKSELKNGQIKETAGKTDETGDTVNVLMDFCEPVEEGENYIIFANNNNGILSPVSGNMSFFKVNGRTVSRLSSEDAEFSMSLGDFEKNYLK